MPIKSHSKASYLEEIILPNKPNVGEKYPLHGVTDEHARQFWSKHNIEVEEDVFVRGVLATRDQHIIKARLEKALREHKGNVSFQLRIGEHDFTNLEMRVLQNAWTRGKLKTLRTLSRLHWLLITACIFAAMTQGWDQAAMAGAAIEIMESLGKPIKFTNAPDSEDLAQNSRPANNPNTHLSGNTWLLGVFVGAPFLFGAPFGLLVTDRLTEVWRFGRRGAICVAGVCSLVSVIGTASVHSWGSLLFFRLLLGAGMAGKASIVPILLSETSPKNVRGVLVVCWQLFVAFGLAAGSIANISVFHLNTKQSWRYMFISAFIPALLLFSLVLFSPESPRWLLKKSGSKSEKQIYAKGDKLVGSALESLIQLRNEPSPILATGELYLLHKRLVEEQQYFNIRNPSFSLATESYSLVTPIRHVSWGKRWALMFKEGRMRRANYAAAAVMIAQQCCGINLLAFLADTFFRHSLFNNRDPTPADNTKLLAFSMGFGLWNFISTIPALFYIDRSEGRRNLLNWSFPGMALSFLLSGLVLLAPQNTASARKTVEALHFIFLAAFTTAYSIGEGPAAFVISSEVFPLVNRELGMSLAVFWNFLGAGLLALLAPAMTHGMAQVEILSLFAGTNILAWFACYWLVPDTGNEDLEDVFKRLDIPTRGAFIYSVAKLGRKICKFVDYCVHFGKNDWDTYGYGINLPSLEQMVQDIRNQSHSLHLAENTNEESYIIIKELQKAVWCKAGPEDYVMGSV